MRTLDILWDTCLVGHLDRSGSRDMVFRYAETYLAGNSPRPVSLSLPMRKEPFAPAVSRAWFANLLPEGEIRWQVARKLGVSERNDFDILEGIGGECAGALRIVPESETHPPDGELVPLTWGELEEAIATRPHASLLALMLDNVEMRLSLAGAQDKLPIHFTEGCLSLPAGTAASTHLLKIADEAYPDLVQNELYCLTLARQAGLPVPSTWMADTETPILLIERYDRSTEPDGKIRRIHQEDFCQALGMAPETKYENEGGPSLEDMFGILGRGSRSPLPDKRNLIRWVLFNFIIGNADAHAKNVSILFGGPHGEFAPRLAPFYDLVCTRIYGGLATKMAQKIGGEYRPESLRRRHWERFAEAIGVNFRYLCGVGLDLCKKIEDLADPVREEISRTRPPTGTLEEITGVITSRMERLRRDLHD